MFSLPEIGVFYLLYPIVGIVDMFTEMVSAKESSKGRLGRTLLRTIEMSGPTYMFMHLGSEDGDSGASKWFSSFPKTSKE